MSKILTIRQSIERLRPDLTARIAWERTIIPHGSRPAPASSAVLRPEVAALMPEIADIGAEARYAAAESLLAALTARRCRLVEYVPGDTQAPYNPVHGDAYSRLDPSHFLPECDIVLLDGSPVPVMVEWFDDPPTNATATNGALAAPKTGQVRSKVDVDADYKARISGHLAKTGRYPTRAEDREWAKSVEIPQRRLDELRATHLPAEVHKGGAPKKTC
jgi:hypothetical protein